MIGKFIRICVVVIWLGIFGFHVARHALPGLGLVQRSDFSTVLARHLDQTLLYSIQHGAGESERTIGSCTLTFQADDNFFRVDTNAKVRDLSFLPGASLLALGGGAGAEQGLDMQLSQKFDDRYRFCALEGYVSVLRFGGRLTCTVDQRGLHGTLLTEDGTEHAFEVPDIKQEEANGIDVVMSLPPGLHPGDSYQTHVLGVDYARMAPKQRPAVVRVKEYETLQLSTGPQRLLRVEMVVEEKPEATLWADDDGTVYRIEHQGGFALVLSEIRTTSGDPIWPQRRSAETAAPQAP
jgi:hypothetical protein